MLVGVPNLTISRPATVLLFLSVKSWSIDGDPHPKYWAIVCLSPLLMASRKTRAASSAVFAVSAAPAEMDGDLLAQYPRSSLVLTTAVVATKMATALAAIAVFAFVHAIIFNPPLI